MLLASLDVKEIYFDAAINNYRYRGSNRPLNDRQLLGRVRRIEKPFQEQARSLIDQLGEGSVTFEDWQRQTARLIKDNHVAQMRFARGGSQNTFAIHYLDVANELKDVQYKYFKESLSQDIKDGKVSLAQARVRVRDYIASGKISYESGRASYKARGAQSFRRRLGACAPHCQPCLTYASWGWTGMNRLVLPGQRCDCQSRCCCSVEFREEPPDQTS